LSKKILVASLLTIFLVSALTPAFADPSTEIGVENREGSVFIKSPYITVKLNSGKPDIFIWETDNTEKPRRQALFHIGFYHIAELFGEDLIVDSRTELTGGKIYNLVDGSISWTLSVDDTLENEIRVTQTSSQLDNGATISFVYHLYLVETEVTQTYNDTVIVYKVKELEEVKFDIIVDNWNFTPDAVGLVFNIKVHELQYRHRIRTGNQINKPEENLTPEGNEPKTNRTQDPKKNGIEFRDNRERAYAYFAWTPEADVFDQYGTYVDTIICTSSATSYGLDENYGKGYQFGLEFINLLFVYPNYGDGMKLIHDPVVGMYDTTGLGLSVVALLAIPILAAAALVIRRKRS
jgi:hypothetical protein